MGMNDPERTTDRVDHARGKTHAWQAHLTAALTDAPDAVIAAALDGTIRYWNRSAVRLYGHRPEEALGSNVAMLVPAEARSEHAALCARVQGGEAFSGDVRRINREGERREVRLSAMPLVDDGGVVIGMLSIEQDVTAQRAEQREQAAATAALEALLAARTAALEESEQRMHACWDADPDGIVIFDEQMNLVSVNTAMEGLFGWPAAQLRSMTLSDLFERACFEGDAVSSLLRSDVNDPHRWPKELTGRRRDGSGFPASLYVRQVDHLAMFLAIVRDIGEERRLQEEIVRTATDEQLRIGLELHDGTQQELTGLGQLAEGLRDRLRDAGLTDACALAEKLAVGIAEANRHVRSLARGLLPTPVDAQGLLHGFQELAHWVEETAGIACRLESPGRLPVRDDTVAIHLYNIARESLSNVIKHSAATAVTLRLRAENGHLLLEIEDDGVGLGAHRIPGASGLGLRIMRHRCSLLGGRLQVGPGGAGGTSVSCRIPLAQRA